MLAARGREVRRHSLGCLCLILSIQREIVSEELEHVSEQHQQLSSAFAAQSAELARAEAEGKELREKLALRETELVRVQKKKERRASVSKVHVHQVCLDLCISPACNL